MTKLYKHRANIQIHGDNLFQVFGVIEYHYILVCKSKGRDVFLGVLYGYKAVLQVIALILAFTTRKVKVKGLNDALYIGMAIYITSLLWAVEIISTYSLVEYLNIYATVFSLGLFVGTTAIMVLIFVPKVSNPIVGQPQIILLNSE